MSDERAPAVGTLVRHWRVERRLSQQALSDLSSVSTRHVSRIETGLTNPSRTMLLTLAEHLDVPLRERNRILLAGGFAPAYADTSTQDPTLRGVMAGLRHLLDAHAPFPALLLDDHWDVVDANTAVDALLVGAAPDLLEPPINVVRLCLDPRGLAPRIVNLGAWAAHLVTEVRHRARRSGDPSIVALLADAQRLRPSLVPDDPGEASPSPVLPLTLRTSGGVVRFFSTSARLTAPTDAVLEGLHLETFLPADEATRAWLTAPDAGAVDAPR